MIHNRKKNRHNQSIFLTSSFIGTILLVLICPVNIFSTNPNKPVRPVRRTTSPVAEWPDSIAFRGNSQRGGEIVGEEIWIADDSIKTMPVDTLAIVAGSRRETIGMDSIYSFNPNPTRAVWLSALFPGLGQLYNRRYWKLPIIIGGYMGLGYATSWNNGMLRDHSRAYADLLDNDPSTKSYMDFFPPTTREEDLNKTWLQNTLKSRKDYYRRNRDLCIICMVGVYILAMVDAYVDASLSHFDITPDLSMDVAPALIPDTRDKWPGVGLQWALNF